MRCPHGRRRNGDQARDGNACCNALSDRAAHRMSSQNRTVGSDYSAREQFAEKRFSALLRACRRKRPRGASVSRQVRNVDAQPLLGKAPRHIRHDFLVRGNSVKQHDRALRCSPWFFYDRGFQSTTAGAEDVSPFPIGFGKGQPKSCAAEQNSRYSAKGLPRYHHPPLVADQSPICKFIWHVDYFRVARDTPKMELVRNMNAMA